MESWVFRLRIEAFRVSSDARRILFEGMELITDQVG